MIFSGVVNRPFPSSKKSHFQNEAKCETFVVKMSFICITIKNHFHVNGFALSLALKVRFFGTRKWPIMVDSQAHVIQVLKYCTQWETFQFALPACNLFTQENESRAWSQLIAWQVFGKIRVLEKSRWNRCKSRLFRFHYSAWFLYFYEFPSMLRRLSSESFNKH